MPLNWRFTVGAKDCGSLVSQGPIFRSELMVFWQALNIDKETRQWQSRTFRASLRPFISVCHCGVESKRGRIRSVRHCQIPLAILVAGGRRRKTEAFA